MDPIHAERGKFYYAIKCGNRECQKSLALIEIPAQPFPEQANVLKQRIEGSTVRCPFCTQRTQISKTFVLEVK
jgi:hypothetical protein